MSLLRGKSVAWISADRIVESDEASLPWSAKKRPGRLGAFTQPSGSHVSLTQEPASIRALSSPWSHYILSQSNVLCQEPDAVVPADRSFLIIGATCIDYSGHPDCRPGTISAFKSLANLATRDGVESRGRFRIKAPLIAMTKEQIIERGRASGWLTV